MAKKTTAPLSSAPLRASNNVLRTAKSEELKPTSGKAMRAMREQGVILLFPSGNHYRVRTLGAANLLRRGNLPNPLLAFAIDALYNGITEEKIDNFLTLREKEEQALEFLESLRVICEEMFMEPRIVEKPQADDEVAIKDVEPIDQGWAFKLAFAPAEALRPFRLESQTDVVILPVAQDVTQAPE